jgi:thioredoxin-like negative regulator of GroEL
MKLPCPAQTCRSENDIENTTCVSCGIPLREYFRLYLYPAHLFNQGLKKAREGQFAQARDLFAAVVHWCPTDCQARNALAATCLELRDTQQARCQWEEVINLSSKDDFARQGLAVLAQLTEPHKTKKKTRKKSAV